MELWWLWHCGGCGIVIGVGVNSFFSILLCVCLNLAGLCFKQ